MPTYAVARWATARMAGFMTGVAASNRFKRFKTPETKLQSIALGTAGLMLSIVVATVVAAITESAVDAVTPDSWHN